LISVPRSFEEILQQLEWDPGHRGRTRCQLHGGDNPPSFSYNEEKGFFKCFSCGAKGDKVTLVMLSLGAGFKEALAFLGITPEGGSIQRIVSPRQPQEAILRRGLHLECRRIGRRLRDEFYRRNRIIGYASERLSVNPDDELGWRLLEIGYKGIALDELERLLDLIDIGSHEDKLAAWRALRRAEKSQ